MAEEDRRLDKLMELFYADAIDVREFKRRRDASADMTSRMRERYDELKARDVDATALAMGAREAVALISDPDVPAAEQNAALRSVVERIDYWREDKRGGKITLAVHLRGLD